MRPFARHTRNDHKDTFKQHILKMVLTRLDFAPLFGFESIAPLYQKHFLSGFQQPSVEAEAGYDIDISDINAPKVKLREHNQVFCLSNNSEKKKIKFSPTSLILEHHKYIDFDSFFKEFSEVAEFVFSKEQAVFSPTRLGLRKINSLILDEGSGPEAFDGYFIEGLLAHLKTPFVNKSLSADRHLMTFGIPEEELEVNLQFSSERGKRDGVDSRRFFLDIDVFTSKLPSNIKECLSKMNEMNSLIFDIFYCSIGPKTESLLKSEEKI